jgi:hypothetical protein
VRAAILGGLRFLGDFGHFVRSAFVLRIVSCN